jgi:hypothetical protein
MTQDEISELARKASLFGTFVKHKDEIETFAKLVAAKERERCCAIVFSQCESDNVAQRTVDAIRGQQ